VPLPVEWREDDALADTQPSLVEGLVLLVVDPVRVPTQTGHCPSADGGEQVEVTNRDAWTGSWEFTQ
jgi:hypothetical protein